MLRGKDSMLQVPKSGEVEFWRQKGLNREEHGSMGEIGVKGRANSEGGGIKSIWQPTISHPNLKNNK